MLRRVFTAESAAKRDVRGHIARAGQDKVKEAEVEIMSPHYGAPRDGNQVAILKSSLPKNHASPFFCVASSGPLSADKKNDPPNEEWKADRETVVSANTGNNNLQSVQRGHQQSTLTESLSA